MIIISRLIRSRNLPRNSWGNREFARRRFVRRHNRPPPLAPKLQRLTDHVYRIKVDGTLTDPLRQFVTDKEFAKLYVEHMVGPGYLPETYQILRNTDDIKSFTIDQIPCVLKPTHLSGAVLFCMEKSEIIDRNLLHIWLNTKYYHISREANYRYLRPKIIIEEFLSENDCSIPKDYKFFCFHGVPKLIQLDEGRFSHHTRNFYDMRWNRLPMTYGYPSGPKNDVPPFLEEMSEIASRLAEPFSFVRVDLYTSRVGIRVGELTFCPEGANVPILPHVADIELARLFDPDYQLDGKACAEAWAAG